jgi:cytidylate kinase
MEPVIAIDGPSGAGKSSVARAIATRGNWRYLDTGALYRAMTLGLLRRGLAGVSDRRPQWICAEAPAINISVDLSEDDPKIFCEGSNVEREIRGEDVTRNVSEVSALPCVRSRLLLLQHEFIGSGGIVVEGRDIGSVVWPAADVKFFLTADLAARARRRHAEGVTNEGLDMVEGSLAQRDQVDSTRSISPLTMATDAIRLDTTEMDFEEVVQRLWDAIERELAS